MPKNCQMKKFCFLCPLSISLILGFSQHKSMAVIGSSTAAGVGPSSPDSAWVNRVNRYYKYQLGVLDSAYNLAVGGTTCYQGMPSTYSPPAGRPVTDPAHNVTRASALLSPLANPADGVVIVSYPTNGYDSYSIAEIMASLQTIYDSAVRTGNGCYVTTSQPRSDNSFASPAIKFKLSVIKDSIINRFGAAHTLNFWDGMFNPADSTILSVYSAGDNVHFNNAGHGELANRVIAKNIFGLALAPLAGDYRSNVVTGLFSDASTWQIYDGTSWVSATAAPGSTDGTITISAGDSIRMNNATTVDQIVVESGAILAIFNSGAATTFTLNDGTGADIVNNGKLYVSINATLTGAGTIQNNAGGVLTVRNQGILGVNTVNDGTMNISGTGNIQNSTLTNNGTITLINFTLNLNNATLINNDSFSVAYTSDAFIATTTGTGSFVNSSGAVLYKASASGIAWINATVAFSNAGIVKGIGQYNLLNVAANTGSIAPGNSPGAMTVNPGFITGKSPVLNLEIGSTGGVAGTNYDQLSFSTVNSTNTNVTGATLNVTDAGGDAVGTVYTLLTSPSGTITGPFASVSLSPSIGNLTFSGNSVTVAKTSPLPLVWGKFLINTDRQQAVLVWSTLQESNVSHFIVGRSVDGVSFTPIGEVPAKGNSALVTSYTYTDRSPAPDATNFYRLQEVDLDGKSSYSIIRNIVFSAGKPGLVQLAPNPVRDVMQITVLASDIQIRIVDAVGRHKLSLSLPTGSSQLSLGDLPAGTYLVAVYQKQQLIDRLRFVKL